MSKCPYCAYEVVLASDKHVAARMEVEHMNSAHPEIVEQRLRGAGFERASNGQWVDTLADPND
jgi:hypothetical protein